MKTNKISRTVANVSDALKDLNIRLVLESLKTDSPDSYTVVCLYIAGLNIKQICKYLRMSRFKVRRRLDYGLNYVKQILSQENR